MPTPVAAPVPVVTPTTPVAKPAAPTSAPTETAIADYIEANVKGEKRRFTREEAARNLSKISFADDLARQAKEALKATTAEKAEREALKARIKTDKKARDAWLREHGIEPDEFALGRLDEKLREAEMTPEQREIAKRDAEIAELKAKQQEREAEAEEQKLSARTQHIQKHVENTLAQSWESAGFEKGADSFMAVYKVMAEWNELGLLPKGEDFTPAFADRIIDAARENIDGAFKALESAALKNLKGKALYERIPKAVRDELNRYQLEQLRGGGPKPQAAGAPPAQKPADGPGFLTPAQALKAIR